MRVMKAVTPTKPINHVFVALVAPTVSFPAHGDSYGDVDPNALLNQEIVASAIPPSDLLLPPVNIPETPTGGKGAADFASTGLPAFLDGANGYSQCLI
jgi:hypothetical protein